MGIVKQAWHEHRSLIIFACLHLTAACLLAVSQGAKLHEFLILLIMLKMTALMTLLFAGALITVTYLRAALDTPVRGHGGAGGYRQAVKALFDARSDAWLNRLRLMRGFAGLIAVSIILSSVSIVKSLIFWITTYRWDPLFSSLDYSIHLGHYPHELFLWLAQFMPLGLILNAVYLSWFLTMFMVCGICLFCDDNAMRRKRYLWSLMLCWTVLGTIMAIIFASTGPLYFGYFQPDLVNPYVPLMDHLHKVGETTFLNITVMSPVLLAITTDHQVVGVNGISAMPSMHMAVAWLMVLYGWSFRRLYGVIMLAYFILMLAGSIYLAWHYAIDGYVAVILTTLIWWGAGKAISYADGKHRSPFAKK